MRDLGCDPVVVVGAGPVGQTTALLLARWGVPTVVLDTRPRRDAIGSKAICQHRDVLDVWEAVGAGRAIADEGVTWTLARTFYRDHELFAVTFADRGRSVFPPFVNISQSRTEELLDEAIARCALIDVRWGHEVVSLDQRDDGVDVVCRTGDRERRVRASYVVACCGARGEAIRSMLGVRFEGRSFDDRFLICDIRAELPGWEVERRFYFDPEWNPDRQVLIHPCPDGTFRIDWQVPSDFDLAAEEADGRLDARIRRIVGDRGYDIVWKSVYRFHARRADRFRVGRVLLAGDMAHVVAPFGARGLNSGVQDAENAAWKIAFVLRGWAPESLLESYHDERLAAALENLEVTSRTMDFLVPQSEQAWAHRRAVLERAVHDPAAREQVDSGRLAEPFWYVDSPLTTPDPRRPFAGRPARGDVPAPAPGVVVPDVPVVDRERAGVRRLREIARDGLLLLSATAGDAPAAFERARAVTAAPVRAVAVDELDAEGLLRAALDCKDGEVWVVRPDAHVAAVVTNDDAAALESAVRRAVGHGVG